MVTIHKLTVLLVALTVLADPAAAETVLRLSNWVPQSHVITRNILAPWAKDVVRVTDGRVRVEMLKAPLGRRRTGQDRQGDKKGRQFVYRHHHVIL